MFVEPLGDYLEMRPEPLAEYSQASFDADSVMPAKKQPNLLVGDSKRLLNRSHPRAASKMSMILDSSIRAQE